MLASAVFAAVALFTSPAPVEVDYWSVQAVEENGGQKEYGQGLDALKTVLQDLPHDKFTLLSNGSLNANYGSQASADLTSGYRLQVSPVEEESPGRVRMRVSVSYTLGGGPAVNALDTRVVLGTGRKMRLGGMKLEKGEMVLVLSAR